MFHLKKIKSLIRNNKQSSNFFSFCISPTEIKIVIIQNIPPLSFYFNGNFVSYYELDLLMNCAWISKIVLT